MLMLQTLIVILNSFINRSIQQIRIKLYIRKKGANWQIALHLTNTCHSFATKYVLYVRLYI